MYIKGLGFVDNTVYAVNKANTTNSTNQTNNTNKIDFDAILKTETDKLNATGDKTYNLKDIFKEASEKYNVSYDMLTSIAWHESRFMPNVTSSAGAMGLMQLMPSTASAMGVTDAYDPYQNVMGAAKLLSKLSEMYDGDQTLTLAAYAAGTGSVAKYGGVPPYGETQEFVSTITSMLKNGGVQVPDKTVSANNATNEFDGVLSKYGYKKVDDIYSENKELYDKLYNSSSISNVLSYSQYQMLIYYFENMLQIISKFGSIEDDFSSNASFLE